MLPQVYNGARATISINNKIVAAAHVADYTVDTKASEIETLDNVFPAELAPDRVRVAMTLKVYRNPDNDPVLDEFVVGSAQIGQAEQYAFTQGKYITVEIKDTNDQTIIYLPRAWIVRRSGAFSAGDFLTETWNIMSIGYLGPST